MTMSLAYVCAPFAPHGGRSAEEHAKLACQLSLLLADTGYAPIVVHPAILAGAYGSDDDPVVRKRGLEIDCALLRAVLQEGGVLAILDEIDGERRLSSGMQAEIDAWTCWAKDGLPVPRVLHFAAGPGPLWKWAPDAHVSASFRLGEGSPWWRVWSYTPSDRPAGVGASAGPDVPHGSPA